MTLDKAIKHSDEVAKSECNECGRQHKQLANWLKELKEIKEYNTLKPIEEWHEDMGDCLFWALPIEETPYCGTPLDIDFDEGYYTHFTRLLIPEGIK